MILLFVKTATPSYLGLVDPLLTFKQNTTQSRVETKQVHKVDLE
jgi:hypothetical protein